MFDQESSVFVQLTPPADTAAVESTKAEYWREMALALHERGFSLAEISRRVHRHNNTVSHFLCQEGVRQRIIRDISWHAKALELADEGPSAVARRLGLTKNKVSGFFDRKGIKFREYKDSSTMERLQALHDMMDTVLAETRKRKSHTSIIGKQVAALAELGLLL